jgi:hypothetical protein
MGNPTDHAIYTLRRLGKDELLDASLTSPTGETVRVIAFVARHDGLFGDCLLAYKALYVSHRASRVSIPSQSSNSHLIRAVAADGTAIG